MGYIHITSFNEQTTADLERAVHSLIINPSFGYECPQQVSPNSPSKTGGFGRPRTKLMLERARDFTVSGAERDRAYFVGRLIFRFIGANLAYLIVACFFILAASSSLSEYGKFRKDVVASGLNDLAASQLVFK